MLKNITKTTLVLLAFLFCADTSAGFAADPPNVVLIFADDLGYGDLGCYGATKVKTPNIDQLAKEGRRFTDAHSASAVCTPSRYGLLTGEYPSRKGIWGPCGHEQSLLIDTNKLTLGKLFHDKGYATAAVGKWHLGFGTGKTDWNQPLRPGPLELGFDYYFGVPKVNSGFPYVYVENDRIVGWDPADPLVFGKPPFSKTPTFPHEAGNKSPNRFSGAKKAHGMYDDERTAALLVEKSVDWIEQNKEKPFFLYLPTTNIHHPFTPAPQFKGTSECGLYGDFIQELDWMVGEVVKCLDDNGLTDNTLVIFTSDNGGMFNTGGQNAFKDGHRQNGDLLGFKFGVWEGGHRIPFIAKWPGNIEPDTTSKQLISSVDMLASFAALTGQTIEKEQLADSVNVLPALLSEPEAPLRDHLVLSPHKPTHLSIRRGKWMYIDAKSSGGFNGTKPGMHTFSGPAATAFVGSVNSDITPEGKIKKDAPPGQLYDLDADVTQTKNVYRQYPEVVAELKTLLKTYAPAKTAKPRRRRGKKKATDPQPAKPQSTLGQGKSSAVGRKGKPNFVIIFTDDQGYQDLGCFGSPDIKTPRIDQMAREGMRFTNFYAQTVCGPSRAALMTGCYPIRLARQSDPNSIHPELHLDEITVAEVLTEQDYATAVFGKWDLAGHKPSQFKSKLLPQYQGFDEFFGTRASNDRSVDLIRGTELIERNADMSTLTQRYTDAAIEFIEKSKNTPFFVYLAHSMPHVKLAVSDKFKGTSAAGLYGDVIEEIDFNVGRVLDKIKELDLDEETYVIFTSDNGPWLSKGDASGRALPLRSGKTSCWEGGLRVPFIIRAPGRVPAASQCDEVAATIDVMPTLAGLAGAEMPQDRVIDGVDLSSLIHGGSDSLDRDYFYYQHDCLRAVRSGKWKLMLPHTEPVLSGIGRKWKNHVAKDDAIRIEKVLLYNLNTDIGETTDLSSEYPEKVAELMKVAQLARRDIGDHDLYGTNARDFGGKRRMLSNGDKVRTAVN